MSIFKRGNVYWYHFLHDGKHIQRSTGQGNPRTARQIEAAFRMALVKREVWITERKKVPAFKTAMDDFLAWSAQEHQAHPATHRRYQVSSIALLRHFKDSSLDARSHLKTWSGSKRPALRSVRPHALARRERESKLQRDCGPPQ